jgi:hypothetical protein
MKLFQMINVRGRRTALFALFLSVSTSLSALSIPHWTRLFFRGTTDQPQEEVLSEEIEGCDGFTEYIEDYENRAVGEEIEEKGVRISSRKLRKARNSFSLQSVNTKTLQPYIEKAKKRFALDEKNPSKKGEHFAQGFIKGVQSSQKGGYKTKGQKKPMAFLKPYISRSGSAKGFSNLLVVSYAFGEFLADLPKQQLPKEVRSIASSWKKLSFQAKGKKMGHFIAYHIQK